MVETAQNGVCGPHSVALFSGVMRKRLRFAVRLNQNNSTMIQIKRTDCENPDFIALVQQLDADLAIRDGEDHAFYAQFNKIAGFQHTVVAYMDGQPVGCGALRQFDPIRVEVKRMYTLPEARGMGVASAVLQTLETWAGALNYEICMLETGHKQPEAIALYLKKGYVRIPNYDQYKQVENSLCFEKVL